MKIVSVKKDSICFNSTRGEYGFVYPNESKFFKTTEQIVGRKLNWIEFNGLTPVQIVDTNKIVWVNPTDII